MEDSVEAPEIFFVAGEPSGDLHAAQLASELLRRGRFRLTGAGGPRMRAAGVATDFDSGQWGAIGIPEALRKMPALYIKLFQALSLIRRRRPALVIYVDFGAFNVRLASWVRRQSHHQPSMYYFPPASWNRGPRDRSRLRKLVDVVATPFEWSEGLLRKDGVNAHFVGHPVLDRIAPVADKSALRQALGVPPVTRLVGLLPGSRQVERSLQGPEMLHAAAMLAHRDPGYHFLWSPSPTGQPDRMGFPPELAGRITVVAESSDIFRAADMVLISFGTATLEAAAAECPMVGMYRGTIAMRVQYALIPIPTKWYAMPNIILQDGLIPELVHGECNRDRLAQVVTDLFADPGRLEAMRAGLREVRHRLGEPGVAARTARLALETMAADSGGLN